MLSSCWKRQRVKEACPLGQLSDRYWLGICPGKFRTLHGVSVRKKTWGRNRPEEALRMPAPGEVHRPTLHMDHISKRIGLRLPFVFLSFRVFWSNRAELQTVSKRTLSNFTDGAGWGEAAPQEGSQPRLGCLGDFYSRYRMKPVNYKAAWKFPFLSILQMIFVH